MTNQATISPAGRLTHEATMLQSLLTWLCRKNGLCSSLMEETVTNLQVLRVLATFLFLTLAVFATASSLFVTLLFLALAGLCSHGLWEKGGAA